MKPKIFWNRQRSSIFLANYFFANGITQKIRKLVEKKSADCITSKQLVGVLDDDNVFADEAKPYKELLRDIIVKGYSQRLLNLGEYSSEVSQLARQYA